ncbi:Biglycan [Amphibalanus amphitrite]|uniref:Biglycan n=2 Tax=Amphibalanus amphitrite TaxID=1232801 RepID=A0A6A4VV57_AMPAM|nr:Biglycan [Amphibalanus amphitrite]
MSARRQRWAQCVVFLLWLALQAHVLNGCPPECSCQGSVIDCSHRKLVRVPRNLPYGATRLDLRNNRLSALRGDDFVGLDRLRSL